MPAPKRWGKPAFKNAFLRRRCLVPADGFYEWRGKGKAKKPYFITLRDNASFAFAGLWEAWSPEGSGAEVRSFAIITTAPTHA